MTFEEWEVGVPASAKSDPVWLVRAYRLGLFTASCARSDYASLPEGAKTPRMFDQLTRASTSIAANVAEGYARRSPADRARFFEYALGSVYELRAQYLCDLSTLPARTLDARMGLFLSLNRLLLEMIRRDRAKLRSKRGGAEGAVV